ncbi:prepilin-type N-terminal cleavage/methylation domain-containing protein [Leptolyngbya sp. BL0902]|uniref:PulJ/GspJ family protein n=1 Tax=Leptolyngbya sp. BL0902 TaxID=1115757 RepID=UPI0018E746A5|nr:prepilin-type N-terminal cleavage/methylation domain-containing protein [Leptolyngbya sp. BL0902]QQE64249.1 prepilin-type N-terminal cleavage/methylation domain-containing protein [Leptolyngbya sp. BL0902]
MATSPSSLPFFRWLLRANHTSQRGFTLIELLVAMIIGSLIMGSLLFLVVELMQANRREEVLTQTQQDMQRAINYITSDVREAVFVYPNPAAIVEPTVGTTVGTDTLLDELGITVNAAGVVTAPAALAGSTPIMAFWRLDPVPADSNLWNRVCSTAFTGNQINECNTLKLRQSFYTLVLYFQRPNQPNELWGGPSRILRYSLPKYGTADIATLTQRRGYSDPTVCNSFATWSAPPGRIAAQPCDAGNVGAPAADIAVLTDYVSLDVISPAPACGTGGTTTPATNARGFAACVNSGAAGDLGEGAGVNQTMRIFLQGNATQGRPGLVNTFNEAGRLPVLEAEVLIRGVLNKQPGIVPQ